MAAISDGDTADVQYEPEEEQIRAGSMAIERSLYMLGFLDILL